MPITAPAARDHTSAAHVISQSMVAQRADTAEELRQQIRQTARSDWELVCVLGDNGRLWGTLMAAELLVMADPTVLGGVAFQEQPRVLVFLRFWPRTRACRERATAILGRARSRAARRTRKGVSGSALPTLAMPDGCDTQCPQPSRRDWGASFRQIWHTCCAPREGWEPRHGPPAETSLGSNRVPSRAFPAKERRQDNARGSLFP